MSGDHRCPEVSVCLPTYNGGRYVRRAVESVLQQSYGDFELIVCDDASSDNTIEMVRNVSDPRLIVIQNEHRLGLVGNWNRCLGFRRGRYVVLMHQDDLMHPDNLTLKTSFLNAHPDIALVHSNIRLIDESGSVIGGHWLPQGDKDRLETGEECLHRLLVEGNFICCPSVMMRSEALSEMGDFDARLPYTTDYEMWLRFAGRYGVGYLAQPLIDYRVHTAQETARFRNRREVIEMARAVQIALSEHIRHPDRERLWRLAKQALIRWAWRQAYWKARKGHIRDSLGYLVAGAQLLFGSVMATDSCNGHL
jgi:glycosyltransferase involved in cell wall biosynthesis